MINRWINKYDLVYLHFILQSTFKLHSPRLRLIFFFQRGNDFACLSVIGFFIIRPVQKLPFFAFQRRLLCERIGSFVFYVRVISSALPLFFCSLGFCFFVVFVVVPLAWNEGGKTTR